MKHCPNPDCPFLAQMGMVAEFHDPIEFCADCGTVLVPGEAPDVEPLSATSGLSDQQIAEMVTLCTLDSAEDAVLFKAKLEFQTIPATIVPVNTGLISNVPISGAADETSAAPIELFEVHVRRDDLLRATYLLDAWMAEELEDADDTDLDDTDLDDDPAWAATANDPSKRDLPIDAPVAARVSAHESGAAERTSARSEDLPTEKTSGSNPVFLIGVILVVVLLVLFVLLRMM